MFISGKVNIASPAALGPPVLDQRNTFESVAVVELDIQQYRMNVVGYRPDSLFNRGSLKYFSVRYCHGYHHTQTRPEHGVVINKQNAKAFHGIIKPPCLQQINGLFEPVFSPGFVHASFEIRHAQDHDPQPDDVYATFIASERWVLTVLRHVRHTKSPF